MTTWEDGGKTLGKEERNERTTLEGVGIALEKEERYQRTMQLHTGTEHFGNMMKRGIAKRGCS